MTAMDDLIAFVTARIDDDERAIGGGKEPGDWCDRATGMHLESDRARREVAAKRAIVAEYAAIAETPPADDAERALHSSMRGAVAAITAIYSDHADYRPVN